MGRRFERLLELLEGFHHGRRIGAGIFGVSPAGQHRARRAAAVAAPAEQGLGEGEDRLVHMGADPALAVDAHRPDLLRQAQLDVGDDPSRDLVDQAGCDLAEHQLRDARCELSDEALGHLLGDHVGDGLGGRHDHGRHASAQPPDLLAQRADPLDEGRQLGALLQSGDTGAYARDVIGEAGQLVDTGRHPGEVGRDGRHTAGHLPDGGQALVEHVEPFEQRVDAAVQIGEPRDGRCTPPGLVEPGQHGHERERQRLRGQDRSVSRRVQAVEALPDLGRQAGAHLAQLGGRREGLEGTEPLLELGEQGRPRLPQLGRQVRARLTQLGRQVRSRLDQLGRKAHLRLTQLGRQVRSCPTQLSGQVRPGLPELGGQLRPRLTQLGGHVRPRLAELCGQARTRLDQRGREAGTGPTQLGR